MLPALSIADRQVIRSLFYQCRSVELVALTLGIPNHLAWLLIVRFVGMGPIGAETFTAEDMS